MRFLAPSLVSIVVLTSSACIVRDYDKAASCDGGVCMPIDARIDAQTCSGDPTVCVVTAPRCDGVLCGPCTGAADCTRFGVAEQVCHPGGGCGACAPANGLDVDFQSADCGSTTPVCEESDRTCRTCTADAECSDGVCDGGQCATEAQIIFMTPGGTGSACSKGTPCKDLKIAIEQVTPARKFVVMATGSYTNLSSDVAALGSETATIIGNGSTLVRAAGSDAVMLRITGTATLNVRDLVIDADANTSANSVECTANTTMRLLRVAIRNSAREGISADCRLEVEGSSVVNSADVGISLSNGNAELRLSRSTIDNNAQGGVLVFQANLVVMANSIVSRNLGPQIALPTTLGNINNSYFGFMTVADGTGSPTTGGVQCSGLTLPIRNSIIVGNGGAATDCATVTHTMGAATSLPPIVGSPMFTATPPYHITAAGAADGAANQSTSLADVSGVVIDRDFDGDARTAGTLDIGADEIP